MGIIHFFSLCLFIQIIRNYVIILIIYSYRIPTIFLTKRIGELLASIKNSVSTLISSSMWYVIYHTKRKHKQVIMAYCEFYMIFKQ